MNILSWFISSLPGMGLDEPVDLESWRNWFIKIAFIFGVIITPFALIATLPVFIAADKYQLIALDCLIWLVFVSRLFSKSQSYKVNAYIILVIIYIAMISFFIELGPGHARPAWLVVCAVMASLLFGRRGAIVSTGLNLLVLIILYWLMGPENKIWAAEYSVPYKNWLMFVINVSVITLASSLLVGFMLDRLDRSLKHERDVQQKLSEESERLKSTNIMLLNEVEQRKQAEDTLRESEEKYRRLVDLSFDGIVIHYERRVVYINSSGAELLGGDSPEDFIGMPILDFIHPDYRDMVIKRIQTLQDDGIGASIDEETFIGLDGREVVVEVAAVPVNYQGKPAIQVVFRDITDLKVKELALGESEKRYRLLIENIPNVAWVTSQDGRTVFISSNVEKVYGYTADEITAGGDEFWFGRIHPDDLEKVQEAFRSLFDQKEPFNVEYRVRRKDGQWIWLYDTANVIEEEEGELFAYGVFSDITERRQAEEESEKIQHQLVQVQKIEAIGNLAGGIAHDFNNMLSVVIGNTELAMMDLDPAETIHHQLKEIHNAAQKSAGLVRQLLAFARKQTITPKVIDINDTISGMLKMLRRLIGEDIDLVWIPGHEINKIKIDPSQLDQILANLMVNARDAINGVGKVIIETEKIQLDDLYCAGHAGFIPGFYVQLAISDNGCGMESHTLEQIFEPFYTTKSIGQGTGLGLATVYGIVKQNNCFINVYSEPGQGTTFRIYIPIAETTGEARERSASEEELQIGSETVLMVEDDKAILEIGKLMLEQLGYNVLTASTPDLAITIAQEYKGKVDLLLTDVVMPQMNGRELARRLQQHSPGLRCLYMSGYTANVIAHHGVLDPGVIFLPKPFSIKELASKMREALETSNP